MILSPDQERAVEQILAWIDSPQKTLTLGGYAGTGKTTIIAHLLRTLTMRVSVCALTGKAASVLRAKGVGATTLHKLIYLPTITCQACGKINAKLKAILKDTRCEHCNSRSLKRAWSRVPLIEADLVIVDEASMLNVDLVDDIEALASKVLYVGDHGQLEPIGKDPGIMRAPQIRLEHIHRQASESGIIQLAHHMRRGSSPYHWQGSEFDDARVVGLQKLTAVNLRRFDIVLCGYNKTRKAINTTVRESLGYTGKLPKVGERLICLQNDMDLGLFNGLLVSVVRAMPSDGYPKYDLIDDAGHEYFEVPMYPDQFIEEKKIDFVPKGIGLFDFGYCLTTHKCISGDTLIKTSDGWSRIEDVDATKGEVATVDGPKEFTEYIKVGMSDMLTIVTENGYSVSVTPDHKMRVWTGSEWELVRADKLREGDFLRLKLVWEKMACGDTRLPKAPSVDIRAKQVKLPKKLSHKMAEFIGLMVSDGTVFPSGIRLAKRYIEVVQRFKFLVSSIFGITAKDTSVHGIPAAELFSVQIAEWLKLIGGMSPNQKYIPDVALKCNTKMRASFLRGLFEDATVNVKDGKADHIEFSNKEGELIRMVQVLLLEYGIISSIQLNKRTPSLYIYSNSIKIFDKNIGFISKIKSNRCKLPVGKETRYRIPIDVSDFDFRNSTSGNARNRGYVTRNHAKHSVRLQDLLDCHYVRIKSITASKGEAYCLTVPDGSSFIQNGFDGSNSQGSEWEKVAVVEQIARAWDPARWRYTAATRASRYLEYFMPTSRMP